MKLYPLFIIIKLIVMLICNIMKVERYIQILDIIMLA